MAKKRYSAEQIIQLLREVEIHTSEGKTISQASRQIGVTEQTYYRWRKEYGGLNTQPGQKVEKSRTGEQQAEETGSRSVSG